MDSSSQHQQLHHRIQGVLFGFISNIVKLITNASITTKPDTVVILTALAGIYLFLINVFNFIIYSLIIVPGYNPYKKFMIKLHTKLIKPFHNIPYFNTMNNLLLFIITTYYVYTAVIATTADENVTNDNSGTIVIIRAIISTYTFLSVLLLQKISNYSLILGEDRIIEIEKETDQIDTIINFEPPSKALINAAASTTGSFLRPDATGLDNIPTASPAFYVMNHSLYGIEMLPFINMLYQEKDIYVRGLGDHIHFALPHAEMMRYCGVVDGTRGNLDILMQTKQNVLVYPGGGEEILKHSSVPNYTLMWKKRLGFARMAIKHGYKIMPCAAVGTEDIFDTMLDIPTPRKGMTIPISKPIMPNNLQKVYFWFGTPIETIQYNGDWTNDTYAIEVRDKTKAAIEYGIKKMQEKQHNDPDRYLMHQWANTISKAKQDAYDVFTTKVWGNTTGTSSTGDDVDDDVARKTASSFALSSSKENQEVAEAAASGNDAKIRPNNKKKTP